MLFRSLQCLYECEILIFHVWEFLLSIFWDISHFILWLLYMVPLCCVWCEISLLVMGIACGIFYTLLLLVLIFTLSGLLILKMWCEICKVYLLLLGSACGIFITLLLLVLIFTLHPWQTSTWSCEWMIDSKNMVWNLQGCMNVEFWLAIYEYFLFANF